MEDKIYYRKGELVKNNAQFVARVVRIARELNKEPATPDETRKRRGLTKKLKREEDDEGFIQVRRKSRRGHRRLGRHR
ncbi:MAG: hypothetical protein A2162_11290 [Deltaproteobacteria bacterium RBG_13_52_11b]|nr:MAG: hypothetical protein A2162_11290 [Deltaproteobacteria bacterium RBG_13_52_11b]